MSGWANENTSTKKSGLSEKDQWIEPPCEDSHVNSVGIRGSNMFLILSQHTTLQQRNIMDYFCSTLSVAPG